MFSLRTNALQLLIKLKFSQFTTTIKIKTGKSAAFAILAFDLHFVANPLVSKSVGFFFNPTDFENPSDCGGFIERALMRARDMPDDWMKWMTG